MMLLIVVAVVVSLAMVTGFLTSTTKRAQIISKGMTMTTDSPITAQIPLRIAVAGGGVGGMFLGFALQCKGFNVTVFEKAAKFSRFGGPIQLASNALSCINSLSPKLFENIMGRFTFTGTRKCGIKDGIRNEWYSVFEAIKNLAEWNDLPYTGVIDRPDLQDVLLQNIQEGTVINNAAINKYTQNSDGTVDIIVGDKEGNEKEHKGFDVVVGADGIWSTIRAQMWNEPSSRPGTCTYSGYTLFAAETVMNPNSHFFKEEGYFDAGYKVYIGPGKYFVTSDVGSGRIQWYAFLALPPGTKSRSSNVEFVKEQFNGWTDEIHACLDNTPEHIVEQRDLYDRRPSILKSWSKGHVTMVGDAVHPMMPNLGQGGCQAIEDAFVLTNLLCDVTDKAQIPGVLQEYYRQRLVRSAIVQGMSRLSSDIIITSFSTPFKFTEFLKEGGSYKYLTFPSVLTFYLQIFLPYIFYAQFGYLYSYSPSSFDPALIKKYVDSSLRRNKAEATKVYESISEKCITYFSAKSMSFMKYNTVSAETSLVSDAATMRSSAVSKL
jgi:zeaxanthin epoxidase